MLPVALALLLVVPTWQGTEDEVAELLRNLGNASPDVRDAAERGLMDSGEEIEERARRELEATNDPEVRERLRRVLQVIEYTRILGPSLGRRFALTTTDKRCFLLTQVDLARLKRTSQPLIHNVLVGELLNGQPSDGSLAYLLHWIGDSDVVVLSAIPIRVLSTRSYSSTLRAQAASTVGQLRQGGETLLQYFGDSDAQVRAAVVLAACTAGEVQSPKRVVAMLKDTVPSVRIASIKGLVLMQAQEAVDDIASQLGDANLAVRTQAIRALGELRAVRSSEQVEACLSDPAPSIRAAAATTIAQLRGGECFNLILPMLQDRHADVRSAVVEAVGGIGEAAKAEVIAGVLSDPEPSVRAAACMVLGDLRAFTFRERVVPLLKDPDKLVRFHAATFILKNPAPEDVAMIEHALEREEEPEVKLVLQLVLKAATSTSD